MYQRLLDNSFAKDKLRRGINIGIICLLVSTNTYGNFEKHTPFESSVIDTWIPTTYNSIYCQSNKGSGTSLVKGTNFGTSSLSVDCSGGTCSNSTAYWYDVPVGGSPLFDADANADGINDSDADDNSATFDPIAAGLLSPSSFGEHTFYVECSCSTETGTTCTSARVPVTLTILDCQAPEEGCTYLLVLEDSGANGWDAASIDVSINLAPPTNYKITTADCDLAIIPISTLNGGFFDLTYWNGSFEEEHTWTVFDALGNIANDIDGMDVHYGPSPLANNPIRVKLDCPENCVETVTSQIVVTLGDMPLSMSWELTNISGDIIATGGTADNYNGLSPNTILIEELVDLESCKDYIFKAYDNAGNSWSGGTWSIQSTDPDRGVPIFDEEGHPTGFYQIANGPNAFQFEHVKQFTIPCKPTDCPETQLLIANEPDNCLMAGFVHSSPPTPVICFPNCGHGIPTPVVNVSYPTSIPPQFDLPVGSAVDLPVGQNPIIYSITYADGSIVRCSSSVDIVTHFNQTLTCNDHLYVSLILPTDENGDCEYTITVDDVLEDPLICDGEYIISITDELGNDFGDTVGSNQVGQTLMYKIRHIGTNNICWGTLTIEDKQAPIINCQNYTVSCNHPEALNENYSHTETYQANTENLPAIIAGNVGSDGNVKVTVTCGPLGEVIQGIDIQITHTHTRPKDLSVSITAPNGDNVVTTLPVDILDLELFLGAYFIDYSGVWTFHIIDNNGTLVNGDVGSGRIENIELILTAGFPVLNSVQDCTYDGALVLLNEVMVETDCNHGDWLGSKILRTWQAIDISGNSTTCVQEIGLRAPFLDQLTVPADITIECGAEEFDDEGNLSLIQTGTPSFGCFEINKSFHDVCDVTITYSDESFEQCGGNLKTFRTWSYIDCCNNVTKTYEQVIKVEDSLGPELNVDGIIVDTNGEDCSAAVVYISPAVSDGCAGVNHISAKYNLGGGPYNPDGILNIIDISNGAPLVDLPFGMSQVEIIATDSCNNTTTEIIEIIVEDNSPPIAICDDELHVSLGSGGEAWLYVDDVDEGSFDNCSSITLEVRRPDGALNDDWSDAVPFSCADLDKLTVVELRVTDIYSNSNICWKEVLIEDALAPIVVCASNKTLSCDDIGIDPFSPLEATDNCTTDLTITTIDSGELDDCGVGTLTRRYTVSDGSPKSADATCSQEVDYYHVSDFAVAFPADVTLTNCALEDTGEPILIDDYCELVAVSSEDIVFELVSDACYKIERTWTVINWCVYDNENSNNTLLGNPLPTPLTYSDDGDGYFQHVQIIKILDNGSPEIDNPLDKTFCNGIDDCLGEAQLSISATDACTTDSTALVYSYTIDMDNDGSIEIIESGDDASGFYPYGTHNIKWTVSDGCGNKSSSTQLFTIEDCKQPSPICYDAFDAPVMQMGASGCLEIWASDFLKEASDNCTEQSLVEESVKIVRVNSSDVPTSKITICCDEIPNGVSASIPLEVWVSDEQGNSDFCSAFITVRDNEVNACIGSGDDYKYDIAGHVETEDGDIVEKATVSISGIENRLGVPTGNGGSYLHTDLFTNGNYTIIPEKDFNPLNGVSTFDLILMSKHILGISNLESPYKLIAADINRDGILTTFDVVQARQLILYIVTDFPSNTSWRFVDMDYVFPNPENPWVETFPEVIHYPNLTQDEMNSDFIGIKIGDLNGDAEANDLMSTNDRNAEKTLHLKVETQVSKEHIYTIDFKAKNFIEVTGYQFTLEFDQSVMKFVDVVGGELNFNESNIGLRFLEEGILTTSYHTNDAISVDDDAVLFSLIFESTKYQNIEEVIQISSRYTTAESYNANGDYMNIALDFSTENEANLNQHKFDLYQNRPNPFSDKTTIGFHLPRATKATLKIHDITGKVLKTIHGDYTRGYNEVIIDADFNASGLLYYTLTTPNYSATDKMIILR